jgi:hypothetical protein
VTDFVLSPGITPLLTDLFVLELPLALGLAYAWRGARGFELALALNAAALGLVKLATDYGDVGDLPVAMGGLLAGALFALEPLRRPAWTPRQAAGLLVVGVLVVLIGVAKAAHDFYDPFDLLLADLNMVLGVLLTTVALTVRRGRSPPSPATAAPPDRQAPWVRKRVSSPDRSDSVRRFSPAH